MFDRSIPHINLFGALIHRLTMKQTLSIIVSSIRQEKQIQHIVVNAAKLVHMQQDKALRKSVLESDLVNADGQSVVWASRLLGPGLPERVAGIDLMENLVALAPANNFKIFLLGAKQEILDKVVETYSSQYGANIIAGYRNGYFKPEEAHQVAEQIATADAHMLFVAITSPKKEIFLNQFREIINTPFIMGVGGSFDVVAGFVKRAPRWMQRSGLEWLYRVYQEPGRMWKRYAVTNSKFCWMLFKAWARQGFRPKRPIPVAGNGTTQ